MRVIWEAVPHASSTRHLRPVPPLKRGRPDADRAATLAAQLLDGNEEAWARLYHASYDQLYRQLRYLAGEGPLAEELLQETFAQAMASRARYDGRRPFRSWLHGIALNVVRKHWRKSRNRDRAHARMEMAGGFGPGRTPDPGDVHVRRERSRMLYMVLDDLPERLREAFILQEIQGLSPSEAAGLLDLSRGNLAVRVSRARVRIREELARRGWMQPDGGIP